jgi:predicted DNA-binding ribbon-helix-helix protein
MQNPSVCEPVHINCRKNGVPGRQVTRFGESPPPARAASGHAAAAPLNSVMNWRRLRSSMSARSSGVRKRPRGARPRSAPAELMPKSSIPKRSIVFNRKKTSMSLEDAFWEGLREIAGKRLMKLSDLVAAIDGQREGADLSSAIRLRARPLSKPVIGRRVTVSAHNREGRAGDARETRTPLVLGRVWVGGGRAAATLYSFRSGDSDSDMRGSKFLRRNFTNEPRFRWVATF